MIDKETIIERLKTIEKNISVLGNPSVFVRRRKNYYCERIFDVRRFGLPLSSQKLKAGSPKKKVTKNKKNYDLIFYYHLPAIPLSPI